MTRLQSALRIAPCLLAIVVDSLGFGMMYPLITAMLATKLNPFSATLTTPEQTNFFLGVVYLLYPMAMFFGNLMLGDLSDAIGRKKVMLYCMGGLVASFLLMGFSIPLQSLFLLCVGRAVSGLMAGSTAIAQAAVADISTKETRALNMSMVTLTFALGLVIGPLIGGVFSDPAFITGGNYMLPFWISAVLALIAGLWTFQGLKETYFPEKPLSINWWQPILILKEAFIHPKIRILSVAFFAMQLSFAMYFQCILIHLKRSFDYSSGMLGIFFGFLGVVFAITNLWVLPYLLKRKSTVRLALFYLITMGSGEILSGILQEVLWIWLLAIAIAYSNMVVYVSMITNFSYAVSKTHQGWVMGVYGSIVALGFVCAGFTTNLLNVMTSRSLLILAGLIAIVGSAAMHLYRKRFPWAEGPS